jgi:OMF family outer membrane factor
VKGQQLFHTFLPGVTAAVLTTQPAWAGAVKVNSIQQNSAPSVLTFTESQNLVVDNTYKQLPRTAHQILPDVVHNSELTTFHVPTLSTNIKLGTLTGNTGVTSAQTYPKNQGSFVSLTPTLNFSQNSEQLNSSRIQKQKKIAPSSGHKLNNTVVNSAIFRPSSIKKTTVALSAIQQRGMLRSDLETEMPTVVQTTVKGAGGAKLLAVPSCSQQMGLSNTLFLHSRGCGQNNLGGELIAQNNTPTPEPASTNVPSNPDPTSTEAAPTTPATSNTSPASGDAVQIPENLIPSSNPLQYPTKTEEVTVQGNQPITLEQALELARRNNRELQVATLQLERSRAALREAQAALYPRVDLTGDVTRSQSASGQLQDVLNSRAGQRTNSDDPSSGFNGRAQLTYDIYTSGSREANIKETEEQVRVSELDVERQSEEIRLTVSTQYYNLQGADEQVRISQSAVENAQASLRDTEALERAGVGTRFDVLRAQVNLANTQQELTNAISQQQIARRQLATTLSLPQNVTISTADAVQLAGLWNRSLEESILLAFQNRPELQQQLAQRNISEQQRRQALASIRPQLSFIANYDLLDQFDDSVGITDGYSVGLRASWNIFDGGAAQARASQARANKAIAETQFADQRNQIRFQVEQAFATQRANLDNVQTANVALEQAREALRLARLRFQAGVGTQTDVINSETDLTRAEGNRVTAILDYNRALAQLQRAVTSRAFR